MRVLLVVLDGVRYDGAMAHDELLGLRDWKVMPCGSHAPYTPSSLTTVATGLYPISHRFWDFPAGKNKKPAANQYFFNWGIPTKWFSTYPSAIYMWPHESELGSVEQAQKFLRVNEECVLVVHAWETHIPYFHKEDINDSIENMKKMESLESRIGYMNHGMDAALARLRPLIDSAPADTVVMVTSDHGEALGEVNPFADNTPEWKDRQYRWMHQHCFVEEMLVPFLIDGYTPQRPFVRLVDIAPTIAEIMGVEGMDFDGQPMSKRFYAVNWSVCRWHYHGDCSWMEQGILCWDNAVKKASVATLRRGEPVIAMSGDGDFRTVMDGLPVFPKDAFRGFHDIYGDPFAIEFDDVFEGYTNKEERAITKKLKALGYLQ